MQKRFVLVPVVVCSVVAVLFGLTKLRNRSPAFILDTGIMKNSLWVSVASGECSKRAAIVMSFAIGPNQDPLGHSGMVQVVQRLLSASGGQGPVVQTLSDHTVYSVVVPSEKVFDELDALAARMAKPDFTDAGLAAAKAQVLAEISKRAGVDATLTAMTDAAESVLPSAGHGRRGWITSEVESIDLAAVNDFWRAHFTAGNARLLVLGDVDSKKVNLRIGQDFAGLPSGTPPAARAPGDMTVSGTLVMGDAPTAVAIAVRAPSVKDGAFPGFLVLAARLLKDAPADHEWTVAYDPVLDPELLFVTGPVRPGEQPEPAAGRIRKSVDAVLARLLSPADVAAAKDRFGLLLGKFDHDEAACARDPRALAVALVRRMELGVHTQQLAQAIDGLTPAQLSDGAAFYAPAKTAAVIAGGTKR